MDGGRIYIERVANWSVIATAVVAVAGIAATFFAPTWSENRISRRRALREFRTAKRLIAAELDIIEVQLEAIAEVRVVDAVEIGLSLLPATEYEAHKTSLAGLLPDDQWQLVAEAYSQLAGTRFMLRRGGNLTEENVTALRDDVKDVRAAKEALSMAEALSD